MPSAMTPAAAEADMADRLDLSAVAPCYNEALGLAEFHRRVSATCSKTVGSNHEIILVNDGSQDGTWSVMSELAASDAHVLAINLARNYRHR
jgi:glycosyltransferase involved in cell wall biosynthesis